MKFERNNARYIATLKPDFSDIPISMFVIAVGLIAIAASLFRLKRKDFFQHAIIKDTNNTN